MFEERFKGVLRVFQGRLRCVLRECIKSFSGKFQKRFKGCQGSFVLQVFATRTDGGLVKDLLSMNP